MHADTIDALGMAGFYSDYDPSYQFAGTLASNTCQVSADRMGNIQWVQCYAIWLPDYLDQIAPDMAFLDWYRSAATWFKQQMKDNSRRFTQARSFSEIPDILATGKVAAILTVENAACLDAGIDVVDELAKDGVLVAGVTWNGLNALGSGNDYPDEGLTDLGRRYVAALEEHGIVLDVSHLNERGFWEIEELATRPYVATHSNARAICDHPRNLTDEQFAAIAARGGLVGLNFHEGFVHAGEGEYGFDELAAHVEHWLELDGEDVIALGTDRDGATLPPWLADCSCQGYLFECFTERFGEPIARKLFFENAMRRFTAYEAGSTKLK